MKIKYFILSGIISSALLSMTVFAEPEKTEKETEPAITVTEITKNTTSVSETTVTTELTTASSAAASTAAQTTTLSFYDEILAYVGEDNAPVLNENLDNNAMTIDSSTIDYSNKSMYTITTRSGDVFYLIINSDGSVYFLNPVDTADLTAILSNSNDNKLNENAIESIEKSESATEPTAAASSDVQTKNKKESGMANNVLLMIAAIVVCVVISAAIAIFKKRRKINNFDNDYFNDPDFSSDSDDNDSIIEYDDTDNIPNTQNPGDDMEEYIDD